MTPDEYIEVLRYVATYGVMPSMPCCPRCGGPPVLTLGGGHQAFCANDACDVFTWDPGEDAATFEANASPVRIFHNGVEVTEPER